MNTHRTRVSLVAVLTGAVAALLLMAGPAGAQVAVNGSVASGDGSFAGNNSTASGQAVAINGSVASGCSFAANGSTASGGVCPAPKAAPATKVVPKAVTKAAPKAVVVEKVTVGEARAAVATPVKELAFTGPRVAPLVTTGVALLAAGAALVALGSPRRRQLTVS